MLRVIREIQPDYVVAENVRGLIHWNKGMVFNEVQADLEASGYEVTPLLLPAAGVNAPHQRYRVWFIGYSPRNNDRIRKQQKGDERVEVGRSVARVTADTPGDRDKRKRGGNKRDARSKKIRREVWHKPDCYGIKWHAPDTSSQGLQGMQFQGASENRHGTETSRPAPKQSEIPTWNIWPTQPPVCGGNDGIPEKLDSITVSKWRKEALKALGNSIVPQVAYQIFQAIIETEITKSK